LGRLTDLLGIAHLEIHGSQSGSADVGHVLVLDVAAVGPQVDGDGVRPAGHGLSGQVQQDGVGVGRVQHGGVPRLTQGGHVIDVDSQFE